MILVFHVFLHVVNCGLMHGKYLATVMDAQRIACCLLCFHCATCFDKLVPESEGSESMDHCRVFWMLLQSKLLTQYHLFEST